jgi:hypothetical protein
MAFGAHWDPPKAAKRSEIFERDELPSTRLGCGRPFRGPMLGPRPFGRTHSDGLKSDYFDCKLARIRYKITSISGVR